MVQNKTSQDGIALIKRNEGLYLQSYICPAGVLTIGYGHTGQDVKPNMVISTAEAELLLRKDLLRFERVILNIERVNDLDLNQNQFDALVSFAFNVGKYNLLHSTLLKMIIANKDDMKNISREWIKWIHGAGVPLRGLLKRRMMEMMLYFGVEDELFIFAD